MTPEKLIDLAKQADQASRQKLFGQITDLFLDDAARLSERERALISNILRQLVADVEIEVRRGLAERIKDDPSTPTELADLLASDEADIALPVLTRSGALRDETLIAIVRDRSRAHAIAIAARQGVSADVADSIVSRAHEHGDTELLETLARNTDATLSRHATAYLVEEAKRNDQFQEPLLRRQDLPADLAMRLYWWVAAAVKRDLLRRYVLDEATIHDALEESVEAARAHDKVVPSIQVAADNVVSRGGQRAASPNAILGYIRSDRLPLATAAFAKRLGLPDRQVRTCLLEGPAEALAVVCREAGFAREQFVALYCLCAPAWPGGERVLPTGRLSAGTAFFDRVSEEHARRILGYWRRDTDFSKAELELAGAPRP